MPTDDSNNTGKSSDTALSAGNASNPSPQDDKLTSQEGSQLLNEKAEKYLRESGSIEELPDAQDLEEMNKVLKGDKK